VSRGRPTRPPLSPKEAWLSDGRQVLHFRPTIWDRWNQRLLITSGELLADQPVPLLKKRWELSRQEALRLWEEKKTQGWQSCPPKWSPPSLRPRDGLVASSIEWSGRSQCS
jgi:hypothetical protein